MQLFNASGGLMWDSRTVGGGVVADVLHVASGATPVRTYPDFAGNTCRVFAMDLGGFEGSVVDTALGYPRVTVAAGLPRTLLVTMD